MLPDPSQAVYIALGSNIDPEANTLKALELLAQKTRLARVSMFYRSAPIGRPEQPEYLNGIAQITCACSARELKWTVLRPIEQQLGRERTQDKYAARTIDLDIALFGELVIDEDDLTLPDPDLEDRPFLLAAPLDLEPDLVLPGKGQPVRALLRPEHRQDLRPDPAFTIRLKERLLL